MADPHIEWASSSSNPDTRPSNGNIRALRFSLVLTALFFVVELCAGFLTGSLALLSDAGHMLSDLMSLAISLFAARFAQKAPTAEKSYGYYRTEVLAALFNGLLLWLMIGLIFLEAFQRFSRPSPVHGREVMIVGLAGLIVNLTAAWVLHSHQDLNVKGAYYHVINDALGSVGAILSGLLISITGHTVFDPLLSLLIGTLVLYSSWTLIRDSVSILMESAPKHLDPTAIRQSVLACKGVRNIHDLHIWSIGSQSHALSAHVTILPDDNPSEVRCRIEEMLRNRFGLSHTTLQMETSEACMEIHE
jgi:cobalt-zinc-cadmium efflux system protein